MTAKTSKGAKEPIVPDDFDKEFDKHFNIVTVKVKNFLSIIKEPDNLIIKGHLLCEYYLNQLLILMSAEISKKLYREKDL